jgi:2-methylcitrate dehydratase
LGKEGALLVQERGLWMETGAYVLADRALGIKFEDLTTRAVEYTKRLLLDTLGCALGAYLSEPSKIVRSVVGEFYGKPEATIIGSGAKVLCQDAAMVNGALIRYLDFNDCYWSARTVDYAHSSETIAAALAVGEKVHATGKAVIEAIVVGYECDARLCDTFQYTAKGWMHHTRAGYVGPVVAGKLLGLGRDGIANAVGIGGSHNHTVYGVYGEGGRISMMKCLGYALGLQSGIVAALLAQRGLTGPTTIIESFNKVVAGNVDLGPLGDDRQEPMIVRSWIKPFPASYESQAAITAAVQLATKHRIEPEDIQEARLRVHHQINPSRLNHVPETREEADHSLLYLLAIALAEGNVGIEQYNRELWKDPKVRDLMGRITITIDEEFNRNFPVKRPAHLEIIARQGEAYQCHVDYPKGTPQNPMTDEELEGKFRSLAAMVMGEGQINRIKDLVYSLEDLDDIGVLMEALTL